MRRATCWLFGLALLGAALGARAETAVFDEVWRTVQARFYDPQLRGLDWEAVGDRYRAAAAAAETAAERSAVINRMLGELGVSHTSHYTPDRPAYYELLDIFSGALRRELPRLFPPRGEVHYSGIGALTREIGGKLFVSGVLHGLPADKAGLRVGDELLAPFHPIQSFQDKQGQAVTLSVRRMAGAEPEPVAVVPERIEPADAFLSAMAASARVIEADGAKIGYIRVWSYAGGRYQELLEREISTGKLRDADALVLDVRDGWGGARPHYLDIFHRRGPSMTWIGRDGGESVMNPKWRKPAAMLVNEGTRSGKEVLADGFKRYGIGEVIGARTAGAVLAGTAFLMPDDSLLILAVSDVLVDGRRLEGAGVTPTIEVAAPLPYAQGADPQLERAVQVLGAAVRG